MAKRVVESGQYPSLTEFVSEAIRLRIDELKQSSETISEKPTEYPVIRERLLYNTNHVWVMVTPEGNVRVGLSDYAQKLLEGIVSVQIDQVGCEVKKGEVFGSVETWLFTFDLYSPISGKLITVNKVPQNEPTIINKDPYEAGWIAEIKPTNPITLGEELRDLMSPQKYETWMIKQSQPQIIG